MTKKKKILLISVLCVLVLGAGIALYCLNDHYHSHFLPGTTVDGTDIGGLTAAEAEEKLDDGIRGYALKILFREGAEETIPGTEIGYRYDCSEAGIYLRSQSVWDLLSGSAGTPSLPVIWDDELLSEAVAALPEAQERNFRQPGDAAIDYTKHRFYVRPDTEGTALDTGKLTRAAAAAIGRADSRLDADAAGDIYLSAAIAADNAALAKRAASLNALRLPEIHYTLPRGKEVTFRGMDYLPLLTVRGLAYELPDEDTWEEYWKGFIAEMAESVYTKGAKRAFYATDLGPVWVKGGTYGNEVNADAETKLLLADLAAHHDVDREPKYTRREVSDENNGIGNTYVEIDLSRQHLWYYADGQLVLDSNIVSGLMTRGRYTDSGVYTVFYKQRGATLQGRPNEFGVPSYSSYVNYWMPFNGGIGMHDASWRGSFGGDIYEYDGSHGCINMPYKKAKELYGYIDYKTPVVCYYSKGCRFEKD